MFNQKSIIVLYIDRGRLQFFGGSLPTIVTLDIPNTIIRDLEVLNKDALYTFIKQWITQAHLQPAQLIIVIAESTYFEKIIESSDITVVETEALRFFDSVPFESIWTKIFAQEKGRRAVAINKLYFEAICQAFSLQGFQVRAAIPLFAVGMSPQGGVLDAKLGTAVLRSVDTLMKYNLLEFAEEGSTASTSGSTASEGNKPKQKANLPILLGVFGFLLLILVVLVITQIH